MELKRNAPGVPVSELKRQAKAYCKGGSIALHEVIQYRAQGTVPEKDLKVGHWYIHHSSQWSDTDGKNLFLVYILNMKEERWEERWKEERWEERWKVSYFYYFIKDKYGGVVENRTDNESWIHDLYEIKGLEGGLKFMNWDRNPLNS